MTSTATGFIRRHTAPVRTALVPEIVLLLAVADSIDVWEATKEHGGAADPAPPFWGFAWPGGLAVARYLLDHPDLARGRTVVDVACGSGVVAIAAALAGASEVLAHDVDERAVVATRLNAHDNRARVVASRADVSELRVNAGDLVLAGDVFYDREMSAVMERALRTAAAAGADVLVGDPFRQHLPAELLTEVTTYDVDVDPELEGAVVKRTVVAWLRSTNQASAGRVTTSAS